MDRKEENLQYGLMLLVMTLCYVVCISRGLLTSCRISHRHSNILFLRNVLPRLYLTVEYGKYSNGKKAQFTEFPEYQSKKKNQ